jgi:hypothetical protein
MRAGVGLAASNSSGAMGTFAGPAAMALLFVFIVGSALFIAFLAWSVAVPPVDPGSNLRHRLGAPDGAKSPSE